jgi:hypothetical protein
MRSCRTRYRRTWWSAATGSFPGSGDCSSAGAGRRGRTILWNADTPVTDDLIVHELVHVEQWRDDPLFALKYCAEWFRHGYHENPFEKVAYARQREYAAQKSKSVPPRPE